MTIDALGNTPMQTLGNAARETLLTLIDEVDAVLDAAVKYAPNDDESG